MNFKDYYLNDFKRDNFDLKNLYVLTCDMTQKEERELGNTGIKIKTMNRYSLDHRDIHPTIGRVVFASELAQFKEGTELICKHFTFEDSDFKSEHFYQEGDTKFFRVENYQVMFGIVDGELEPREGVLLCEGVEGKFIQTDLEVNADMEGRRRDIAKVVKVWKGCTEFKAGDYVMLKMGADYEFKHDGKTYIKVDTTYGDAYAVTDDKEWYDSVLTKHVTHQLSTENINKQLREKE